MYEAVVWLPNTPFISPIFGLDNGGQFTHRRQLRSNNNIPVIPGRKNRKIPIKYDKKIYALRKRIEMFFGKLKENKRLGMRFEKLDHTFLAFIALASLKIIINSIIS